MVFRVAEADENDEVAENNEVDIANGGVVVSEDGRLELANGWTINPDGADGRLEIIDEENETVGYLARDESGNLLATGDGGGGDSVFDLSNGTATPVSDVETVDLSSVDVTADELDTLSSSVDDLEAELENHDHSGDRLGETDPLQRINALEAEIQTLKTSLDADGNDVQNIGHLESQSHSTGSADVTNEVSAGSVRTEGFENTGGPISLIKESTARHRYRANTLEGLETETLNGGDINVDGIRLDLQAGAAGQTNGFARAQDLYYSSWVNPSWEKRREVRISFWMSQQQEEAIVTTGRADQTNYTEDHIGVSIEGGDILATCADGSSRTTETLDTGLVGSDQYELVIDFRGDKSTKTADITLNRHDPTNADDAPLSTYTHTFDEGANDTLPSGTDNRPERDVWGASARTPNAVDGYEVHVNSAFYVGYPSYWSE